MNRRHRVAIVAVLALAVTALAACAAKSKRAPAPSGPPLRIGVTATSPPFSFRRGEEIVGLEVDFARELAAVLGRRLRLVELPWEDQLPALQDGRVDIIMSGMTITPARQVRIAFSEPYLRSGLLAIVRRDEVARYPTRESVLRAASSIGVVSGTTGERFVREHFSTSVSTYPTPAGAVTELRQRRVDVFVHDAPVGLWYVSANEADLAPVLQPLNTEQLGWGMRRTDEDLRTAANSALARWRQDGTRDRILTRWVPYWTRLEAEVAKLEQQ
jgi:ABC-type amino acid transport substrate-binding protein